MATEEPVVPESDPSITSRLSAVFAQPEEAEPEAAEPTEEAPAEEAAPEEEEFVDFEVEEGKTVKVPLAAKDAMLRHADYTRKTQAAAAREKLADDRLQFAEAKEQLGAAIIDDLTEYRSLEKELKQYAAVDWGALYKADPGQAFGLQQRMQALEKEVATKKGEIETKASNLQSATAKHREFQWQEAEKAARTMIGSITAEENVAMAQTVRALGLTEQQFKDKYADPAIIALTHKAAKWDMLQAGKPASVAKAQNAPPIVKPGASKGASAAAEQRYKDVRQSLKKSGSLKDAARLFMMRGNS